jgi:serine/threonine protein kinase
MYLRDARHLDKFIYTLSDALFYEPFEAHYKPSGEYFAVVTLLLKDLAGDWEIKDEGYWFHVHPREYALPAQGWKIHVSATLGNGADILRRTAIIALANCVPFKFALDRNILSLMSSKKWDRGSSGKFITLYPADISCFKTVLEELYAELHSEEGPYVLSDRRYKDCRVLYYRFGGFKRTTRVDIRGERIPVLTSPTGETLPDLRNPYYALPSWVDEPFPEEESKHQDLTLNGGRYLVKQALNFSNSGGVYLADDRNTGTEVVIKEARAHTLMDSRGNDAITLLKKEHAILELLGETGIAPKPVESFYDWENFFLAQEYVNGLDIREIMLTESPLMRVRPSLADSSHFYEHFKRIFTSFTQAVTVLHEHGIAFGDLSANNIKIDPSTYAVRLIDFEGSFRINADEPTFLYTPGFRDPLRLHKNIAPRLEDDLYSLAAIMLYTVFPIHALSSLRGDLYDKVLRIVLADVGWSQTPVFNIIGGLSRHEISCPEACEQLSEPAQILPPRYRDEVEDQFCDAASHELGRFILGSMRDNDKRSLFPADPFVHETNSLSLGFGACGILYALKKCGLEIPTDAYNWLEQALDGANLENLAPGLFTGSSGIAWCLWELGLDDRAADLMSVANRSPILKAHHSYLYGMAGIGMANIYLYLRTKKPEYLAMATQLGSYLLDCSQKSENGIFWESENLVHLGYGYGQSGVALFLLRLYQVTGSDKFLTEGRRALEFDLSHGIEIENGVLSFPRGPSELTLEPYLEQGSAGIAKVALRYGLRDELETILLDVHRKYSVFAGLLFGLGGFIDILTDAFLFSKQVKFLDMARRPVAGIRDLYLVKESKGSATPGDGLLRISCDYATGIAGVLRALHRFTHLDEADFVLDELSTASLQKSTAIADVQIAGSSLT